MTPFDVLVVGSLHFDVMFAVPRLPMPDETLIGRATGFKCGGKGGNQSVAAARAGASTAMIGRVGADTFGERLVANLKSNGIDCSGIGVESDEVSGLSTAVVDPEGSYSAVVASGANLKLKIDPAALPPARVLLLQNEVPEDANIAAATAAPARGATVILNAAPARPLADGLAGIVDLLIVNRVEAAMMLDRTLDDAEAAAAAALALASRFPRVIVTLGGDGLVIAERAGTPVAIPAERVEVRSTHGAGDVFCGVVAARLAAGDRLAAAAAAGSRAAARHVSGT